MKLFCGALATVMAMLVVAPTSTVRARTSKPQSTPTPITAVITFSVIRANDARAIIEKFYARAHIVIDPDANALIVSGTSDDVNAIRQIASGIDTKSALAPVTQSIALHRLDAEELATRLHAVYSDAKLSQLGRHTLLVSANSAEMQQIQALVLTLDQPPPTPGPQPSTAAPDASEAVPILKGNVHAIAREVAGAVRSARVLVAGNDIIVEGSPDALERAKGLISVLDAPPAGIPYTAVYRIRTLDAKSVADLLERSFPNAKIIVDEDINSISVTATAAQQALIADGIAKIDGQGVGGGASQGPAPTAAVSGGSSQLYTLKYALPGTAGAPSTSASDLAAMVTQTLASQAPDLHVTVAPNSTQLLLSGNPYSIKEAKDLLAQLDVAQPLIVLDTEILEVDENTAKNLGIQLSSIVGGSFSFGTVFSEVPPTPDPGTGITPPLKRLQPLTRTPIGFIAVLNLAVQHGEARVLADPRITTLSGHTATIRAGDNISIQLQAGGGPGTIATTQIQTFQTGVTLDITPIVNDGGLITVALHPVVNSLTGILNGIPQISTRDTQTTVALNENETLVIGGLIQDNTQRTESRIPFLGDLPLVGRAFRNETLNGNRNELIITVTPHILHPGQPYSYPGPPLPAIPTPAPLPTLPPGTVFPVMTSPRIAPTPMPTSSPLALPGPTLLSEPPMTKQNTSAGAKQTVSPLPGASPVVSPSATALNQAEPFTYRAPPGNISQTNQPAILFAQFSPTILTYGTAATIVALTSTNVSSLTLTYDGVSLSVSPSGPGRWQGTVPFTLSGDPSVTGDIAITLIAKTDSGLQTSIVIPVKLVTQSQ